MARYRALMQEVYVYMAEFEADNDDDALNMAWEADYGVPLHDDLEEYLDDRDIVYLGRIAE
jgi:hypothetical protein